MTRFAIIVCCAAAFTAACARYGAEQLLLEQFFSASRLRDRTALQQMSTVVFEPREQGTVRDFTITRVSEIETPAGGQPSKQVIVQAPVHLPDGRTASRQIVLVLQRRDRWIVTGFTVAANP
jgi:hypothetical protein